MKRIKVFLIKKLLGKEMLDILSFIIIDNKEYVYKAKHNSSYSMSNTYEEQINDLNKLQDYLDLDCVN